MTIFCDNKQCKMHVDVKDELLHFRYIIKDKKVVRLHRHLYRDGRGNDLFLCDVCHNAVKMVVELEE